MKILINLKKGFTLVELMVVIAIIVIVAAVAVPMYMKHQIRSKITSADVSVKGYIDEITHYVSEMGKLPADDSDIWGCADINRNYVVKVCREKESESEANVKVHVDPTLDSNQDDPYYEYKYTLS